MVDVYNVKLFNFLEEQFYLYIYFAFLFFFKLSCSYYLCLCALVPGLVCFLYNGVDFLFMISVVCVCVCFFLLFFCENIVS